MPVLGSWVSLRADSKLQAGRQEPTQTLVHPTGALARPTGEEQAIMPPDGSPQNNCRGTMLFTVIERYEDGNAEDVSPRLQEKGRITADAADVGRLPFRQLASPPRESYLFASVTTEIDRSSARSLIE